MKTKAHYARTAKKLKKFKQQIKDLAKQHTSQQSATQQSAGSNFQVSPMMFLTLPF
jgi:hypothetical protein